MTKDYLSSRISNSKSGAQSTELSAYKNLATLGIMSNLYQILRAGGKLDAEINRKLYVPGRTALQWTSAEVWSK